MNDEITRIARGTSLLECKRIAKELGCDVSHVKCTGEVRFRHPKISKSMRVDNRRKDASRHLTAWLNRICKLTTNTIQ